MDKNNKTGCRFVIVDSYNKERPLKYYAESGFIELFSTEEQEKEFTGLNITDELFTRLMYFDLIYLQSK